jgi:hypothetical protein
MSVTAEMVRAELQRRWESGIYEPCPECPADRLEEALVPQSTAAFFDALDAADRASADAAYNAELAESAPLPEVFGRCVCGSEYSVISTQISLTDGERNAAARALAWHEMPEMLRPASVTDGPYTREVDIVIRAINAAREQADIDFINNWNDSHSYCGEDFR